MAVLPVAPYLARVAIEEKPLALHGATTDGVFRPPRR